MNIFGAYLGIEEAYFRAYFNLSWRLFLTALMMIIASIFTGLHWYLNQFPKSHKNETEQKILLEKSSAYFRKEFVAKRVWETNPKTSIIMIVKDPFHRMVSHFLHGRDCRKRKFEMYKKAGIGYIDLTLGKPFICEIQP